MPNVERQNSCQIPQVKGCLWGSEEGWQVADFKREWLYFTADPAHMNFLSDAESAKPIENPVIVHWAASSRGDAAKCLHYAGDIKYDLDTEDANLLPAYKDQCLTLLSVRTLSSPFPESYVPIECQT